MLIFLINDDCSLHCATVPFHIFRPFQSALLDILQDEERIIIPTIVMLLVLSKLFCIIGLSAPHTPMVSLLWISRVQGAIHSIVFLGHLAELEVRLQNGLSLRVGGSVVSAIEDTRS